MFLSGANFVRWSTETGPLPRQRCYSKNDLFIDSPSVSWVLRRTREWHKLCLLHALLGGISKQIMPNHYSGGVLTFMTKFLGSFGVYLRRSIIFDPHCYHGRHPLTNFTLASGQALVEFTLTFLLLLVVAWIPADFGLGFYTGQLAHNAAREGARIAAADPTLISGTTSCVMPACTGNIFQETAGRLSPALLPAATITLNLEPDTGTNCNRMVTVTVSGNYNFFFYRLLYLMGASGNLNNTPITRQTRMRWEGQAGCS
jgi:hypothetical protein